MYMMSIQIIKHSLIPCFSSSMWSCLYCTKVNSNHTVLCEECEHPRLESNSSKVDERQPATGLCCPLVILSFFCM